MTNPLSRDDPHFIQKLKEWNTKHTNEWNVQMSVEEKDQFVRTLVNLTLESSREDYKSKNEELTQIVIALRLLAREESGLVNFLIEDMYKKLLDMSSIIPHKDDDNEISEFKIESAKCLVNLLYKSNSLLSIAQKEKLHLSILSFLQSKKDTLNPDQGFPYFRLLFFLLRPVEGNELYKDVAVDGIRLSFDLLKRWLQHKDYFDESVCKSITGVSEVVQFIFINTLSMGTLAKSEPVDYQKYLPKFEEDIPILLDLFNLPLKSYQESPLLYQLKVHLFNCFINIPVEYTRILVVLGDKDLFLKNFFDMIEMEVMKTPQDEVVKSALMTMFMVAKNLLHKAPEVRPYAFQRLFPGRDLEKEKETSNSASPNTIMETPQKDAPTVGNKIISLMTSLNMSVKYVSNEVLFALVGEDADEFVRLCGFGHAAGLLAMRNLFGLGEATKRDTLSEFQAQNQGKSISSLNLREAKEGETEEEKEDRIAENFEKMVESGIIKLVRKEDKDESKEESKKSEGDEKQKDENKQQENVSPGEKVTDVD